ncbi:MAG: carboxypeptidase-like regulatory domain-containing protein [Planctomycetes bacterium]|nr:carboxypeptidase-like regulatory domain-containing protein [Planctomycetota bacterium]
MPKGGQADPTSLPERRAVTGGDGSAWFGGVPPGKYAAILGGPGPFLPRSRTAEVAAGETSEFQAVLVPPTRVLVRLFSSPVGGASRPRPSRSVDALFVDEEGNTLPALPHPDLPALSPGEYLLRLLEPGREPVDHPVRIEPRGVQEVDLPLDSGGPR